MNKKNINLFLVFTILMSFFLASCGQTFATTTQETSTSTYEDLFIKDNVINITIEIDESDWNDILENPLDEEYKEANILVDGIQLTKVAFRTKGNSTLKAAASSDTEKYSFKIKTNKYDKSQTLLGLDEFVLNSNIMDVSNMREYLSYELLRQLGAKVPLTSYASLYINGSYHGLYLMVESIDTSFIERNFEFSDGSLYKADQGSTLEYNESNTYNSLEHKSGKIKDKSDLITFIKTLNTLENGSKGSIEEILDVDSVLKYFAVNFSLANYDSYQGNFSHNYYLYKETTKFTLLPWDYDLSFGSFSRNSVSSISIDSPVESSNNRNTYPLLEKLLSVKEYREQYYDYIKECILFLENVESRIEEISVIISPYIERDTKKGYTMEDFNNSVTFSSLALDLNIDTNSTENRMSNVGNGRIIEKNKVPPLDSNMELNMENRPNNKAIDNNQMPNNQFPNRDNAPNGKGFGGNMMNKTSLVNFVRTQLDNLNTQIENK